MTVRHDQVRQPVPQRRPSRPMLVAVVISGVISGVTRDRMGGVMV
jgi:hypothetical protein